MKIMIYANHLPLTPAIKNYALQKFSRLTKYSNKLDKIHLHLASRKHISRAATDFSFNGIHCYLKARSNDLYTAVNELSGKVSNKIKDLKNRPLSASRVQRK